MTEKTEKQKLEDKIKASDYSCHMLLENATKEQSEDKSFPTDAFIVRYILEGKNQLDVVRSEKMVNVFDYYYDRYGRVIALIVARGVTVFVACGREHCIGVSSGAFHVRL